MTAPGPRHGQPRPRYQDCALASGAVGAAQCMRLALTPPSAVRHHPRSEVTRLRRVVGPGWRTQLWLAPPVHVHTWTLVPSVNGRLMSTSRHILSVLTIVPSWVAVQ